MFNIHATHGKTETQLVLSGQTQVCCAVRDLHVGSSPARSLSHQPCCWNSKTPVLADTSAHSSVTLGVLSAVTVGLHQIPLEMRGGLCIN